MARTWRVSSACLRRLQCDQRSDQHTGAGQQYEGCGDLCNGEDPLAAARAAGDPYAAARQAKTTGRIGRRQARDERQNHRRDDGQRRSHPEHAGIDRQIERADGEARGVAGQDGHHWLRADYAESSAGAAKQKAFGQQHAAQRACAGAERRADGQLAFAANRPRENQVGDVGTRDDEDQS